ncbi:hypothetical protein TIFTF001_049913 [Ficus carica]|uniref:Uncharacterized protein n=1 Tax=Ficus carica TaxID=3494 RepID=A0AA88CJ37_FICCA|nr:hypothetical protein TIFTF001_049913 [Ficus carica]
MRLDYSFWARRRASDVEVQSLDSSRHRLSRDGGYVRSSLSIGADLTYLGGKLSVYGGFAQIWLSFDGR